MKLRASRKDILENGVYKRYAWIAAAIIAAIVFFAYLEPALRSGMGMIFFIPFLGILSLLSLFLLRLILGRVFLVLLDEHSKIIPRILSVIGVLLILLLTVWWASAGQQPNSIVQEAEGKIPTYEAYFWQHRDEFEAQREDALQDISKEGNSSQEYRIHFSSDVDSQWLFTEYIYDPTGAPKVGYRDMATFYYPLDQHWYISIHLMSPI